MNTMGSIWVRVSHVLPGLIANCVPMVDAILHVGDMKDASRLESIVSDVRPHEIYNLAALSHVSASWDDPESTMDTNFLGLVRILQAVRHCDLVSHTRILNVRVQSININSSRLSDEIYRPAHLRCLGKQQHCQLTRTPRLHPERRMPPPKLQPSGLCRTTGQCTVCLLVLLYFSIMSIRGGVCAPQSLYNYS